VSKLKPVPKPASAMESKLLLLLLSILWRTELLRYFILFIYYLKTLTNTQTISNHWLSLYSNIYIIYNNLFYDHLFLSRLF
jgi:hypothetical protein